MAADRTSKNRHPRWRRRGAFAAGFAIASIGVLGMVGLATEGGLWYMARRNAQTAVDTGAFAGASQLSWRGRGTVGQGLAFTAAGATAGANGFATEPNRPTTVTVRLCTWTGTDCTDYITAADATRRPNAAQVDVEQTQFIGLVRLISSVAPTMRATGIAAVTDAGSACLLALTGVANFTGNATVTAPECTVASNRATGEGANCGNSSQLQFRSIRAVGSISDVCDTLGVPIAEFASPATDPYAHLRDAGAWMPTFNTQGQVGQGQNQCQQQALDATGSIFRTENGIRTFRPRPFNSTTTTPTAICGDIRIENSSERMILTPGTYFFTDGAGLKVTGGSVSCDGCTNGRGVTLVFTGRPQGQNAIGNMQITGGQVDLNAPRVGPWYEGPTYQRIDPQSGNLTTASTFEGILIYRDDRAGPNNEKQLDQFNAPNTALIAGNADTVSLNGGVYLPTTSLQMTGNSVTAADQSDCQSMVAANIQVPGTSSFGLSLQGCAQYGTSVSQSFVVRLVR